LSVCSGVWLLASLPDWLVLLLMPAAAAGTSVCVDMRLLASRLARAALQLLLARGAGPSVRSGSRLLANRLERAALLLLSAPARGLSISSGVGLLAGLLDGWEVESLPAAKWANVCWGSSGWEPQPERCREALPAGEVACLKRPAYMIGTTLRQCKHAAVSTSLHGWSDMQMVNESKNIIQCFGLKNLFWKKLPKKVEAL